MIVSKNGVIQQGGVSGTPSSWSTTIAPTSQPTTVQHPLGVQPSDVDFVDAAGAPHGVDWTCDTTFPFAVHLPAVLEAGTLTVR